MQRLYDCAVDTDLLTGMRLAKIALQRDELVVLPTDTVYGLAANAFSHNVPQIARSLANTFWPGALTMILKAQPSLQWDLGETKGTVALRMPDHKIALALLEETGPLAVSSANLTGESAATTCQQAEGYLGASVSAYLDGGPSPKGEASTILDLTSISETVVDGEVVTDGKIRIVRIGALKKAKLKTVVGDLFEVQK